MRLPAIARQLALGALALWLGLWPAGDAVTGASRTMIVLAPAAEEPTPCCGHDKAAAPPCASVATACGAASEDASASGCHGAEAAHSRPSCADTKAARCGHCSCVSGIVLFATAPQRIEPLLELVGTLSPSRRALPSRHPQPPARPPAAALPTAA